MLDKPVIKKTEHNITLDMQFECLHKHEFGAFVFVSYCVFQLHLHVNTAKAMRNHDRIQPLHCVIRNLEYDDFYYRDALILTRYCKTMKRIETHSKLGIHI